MDANRSSKNKHRATKTRCWNLRAKEWCPKGQSHDRRKQPNAPEHDATPSPPRSTLWTSINCELSSFLTPLFSSLLFSSFLFFFFFFFSFSNHWGQWFSQVWGEPIKCLVLFKLSVVVFPNSLEFFIFCFVLLRKAWKAACFYCKLWHKFFFIVSIQMVVSCTWKWFLVF